MMMACDTLLMVGSGFPYSEFLPKEGQARGVQIDIKADMLSIRYPMEVNLVGDARETLKMLLPLLRPKADASWRADIEKYVAECWKRLKSGPSPGQPGQSAARDLGAFAAPSRPGDLHQRLRILRQLVCARLEDAAGHDGVAVGRPRVDGRGRALCHRGEVRPSRPSRHRAGRRRRHADEQHGGADHGRQILARLDRPRWIVCVFNNEDLNQVTWEQRVMEGDPKFVASQQIPNVPYHKFGELLGFKGIYVDDPEKMGAAWDEALASTIPGRPGGQDRSRSAAAAATYQPAAGAAISPPCWPRATSARAIS